MRSFFAESVSGEASFRVLNDSIHIESGPNEDIDENFDPIDLENGESSSASLQHFFLGFFFHVVQPTDCFAQAENARNSIAFWATANMAEIIHN